MAAVVIVALVVVAAGAVYLFVRPQQRTQQDQQQRPHAGASSSTSQRAAPTDLAAVDRGRTRQVGEQIDTAVATAYSYDSSRLRAHRSRIGELVVGKARAELDASLDKLRGKPRASVRTKVVERAVTELSGDHATVLLVLNERVRSKGKTTNVPARMLVTARHRGALWQITDTETDFAHPRPAPKARGAVAHGAVSGTRQLATQRDLLLGAARHAAEVLGSSDYRHPAKSLAATTKVTTGKLHDKAVAGQRKNPDKLAEQRAVVTARSVAAGVQRMDLRAGKATVLVALNAEVAAGGDHTRKPSTVALRLRRAGEHWLVSGVRSL